MDNLIQGRNVLASDPVFGPLEVKFREAIQQLRDGQKNVRVAVTAEEREMIEGAGHLNGGDIGCESKKICFGECEVYLDRRQVFVRGRLVRLRLKEYLLLCALIDNPQKWVSYLQLAEMIGCAGAGNYEGRVKVTMSTLRCKLELSPRTDPYIHAAGGYGFFPDTEV